jgi:hypothetical protein
MRPTLRFTVGILLPAIIIFCGLMVLTGCFFLPTFNVIDKGTNVAAKVGDARSKRPVRIGLATKQQIIAMFGKPPFTDDTGRRIGYAWTVKNGIWIYPFCFASSDQRGDRGIELDFNENGILQGFHLVAADDRPTSMWELGMPASNLPRRPPFAPGLHPNGEGLRNR